MATLNKTSLGESAEDLIQSAREFAMALGGVEMPEPLHTLEERFDADVVVLRMRMKAEPFGYYFQHKHDKTGEVVGTGFHTTAQLAALGFDVANLPPTAPLDNVPGFTCHFTPLYHHENP